MCFLVCSSAVGGISKRPGSPEEQRAQFSDYIRDRDSFIEQRHFDELNR